MKRTADQTSEETERRRPATEVPADALAPKRGRYKYRLFEDRILIFVSQPVLLPLALGLVTGLALIYFFDPGLPEELGRGLVIGGMLTGGFTWTQEVVSQLRGRRELQVQLGMGTDLRLADLAKADLTGAYLRHRQLAGARLSEARSFDADFTRANLMDARLTNGTFVGSSFAGADLTAIGAYRADLRETDLRGAILCKATLCHADLRLADLTGADLRSADLRCADLRDARLDDADLRGCWFSKSTKWPLGFESTQDRVDETDELGRLLKTDASEGPVDVIDVRIANSDRDEGAAGRSR